MAAYYNEYDPKAAAWLRELIKQGHIADGVVDDRSIEDVTPTELLGFTQCHFFAGIGVWSYALRSAGWADDRPVWTGSCPCQPFSAAGKGAGFDDERHLWPAFHHLISQCQPPIVLGEQVASKDGLGWLDLVHADLEATGYASGAVDLCAAGIGAPHIRQRLWWVGTRLADTPSERLEGATGAVIQRFVERPSHAGDNVGLADALRSGQSGSGIVGRSSDPAAQGDWEVDRAVDVRGDSGMADTKGNGWDEGKSFVGGGAEGIREGRSERRSADGAAGGLADPNSDGRGAGDRIRSDGQEHDVEHGGGEVGMADTKRTGFRDSGCRVNEEEARGEQGEERQRERIWSVSGADGSDGSPARPSPTNGHWRDADWLFCRDGKWRPVEPSTFPLAHGSAARVGRLRGYGNAIVAQAAQAFVESVMGE